MRKRKNFFPAFLLTILSWLLLSYLVLFTAPDSLILISIFYFLVLTSFFLTFSLILANSRQGLMLSLFLIILALLKQIKILNIINFAILLGIFISLEIYFANHKP
jgi:hypothetical protein